MVHIPNADHVRLDRDARALLQVLAICCYYATMPTPFSPLRSAAVGLGALLLILAGPLAAQQRIWEPEVYSTARFDDNRMVAAAGLLVPFAQRSDRLLFADARGHLNEYNAWEGDFGFGYRRLLAEGRTLVGGYGYVDETRSELGNGYQKVMVGLELQGERWSARGHSYFVGDAGSGVLARGLQAPAAAQISERGMDGWDVEWGSRLPIAIKAQELWLYAAYYRFDASGWEAAEGPRVRLDWRVPLDWVAPGARVGFGLQWQQDDLRGGQEFASIRFQLPMNGRMSGMHSAMRVNHWSRSRMAEPPERGMDVVTGVRGPGA